MSKQYASLTSLAIAITTLELGSEGVSFPKVEVKYHKKNLNMICIFRHYADYKTAYKI